MELIEAEAEGRDTTDLRSKKQIATDKKNE